MVTRRGVSRLGCLVWALLFVGVMYFGVNIGHAYYRYYQFEDAMDQEVRFRSDFPAEKLESNLRAAADSIGLPADAGNVKVTKENGRITIESQYDEIVELPGFNRTFHFEPRAVGSY